MASFSNLDMSHAILMQPPLLKPNSSPTSVLPQPPFPPNLYVSVEQNQIPSSSKSLSTSIEDNSESMNKKPSVPITLEEGVQSEKSKKIKFVFNRTKKESDSSNKGSCSQVDLSTDDVQVNGKRSRRVPRKFCDGNPNPSSSSSLAVKKSSNRIMKKKEFCIRLSREEVEQDFFLITGLKKLPRPKKLGSKTQKDDLDEVKHKSGKDYLDSLFPGGKFRQK